MNCNCKDCHRLTKEDWIQGACVLLALVGIGFGLVMGV